MSTYYKKGMLWSLTGKASSSLAVLATTILLTRLLPPEDVGLYYLLMSVATFTTLVAKAGHDQRIIREISKDQTQHHVDLKAIQKALTPTLTACLFLSSLCFFLPLPLSKIDTSIAALIISLVLLQSCTDILSQVFKAKLNIPASVITSGTLSSVAFSACLFALSYTRTDPNISTILSLQSVTLFFSVILSSALIFCLYTHRPSTSKPDKKIDPYPFYFAIMMFFLVKTDIWICELLHSDEMTGIYGVALRLITIITAPLYIVDNVVAPVIAKHYHEKSAATIEHKLRTIASALLAAGTFATIIFFFSGRTIIETAFGDSYSGAYEPLLILCIGYTANLACGSGAIYLLMTYQTKALLYITFISGIIGLGASILAGRYSISGVALGTTLGLIVQNIMMCLYIHQKDGIKIFCFVSPIEYLKLSRPS